MKEYDKELKQCPECMTRAYILSGAYDYKEYGKYVQFFKKIKMTDEQIRDIYIEKGMKTKIYPDAMTIWYQEDTWRIKSLPKKGHVQLYHNNYIVKRKGIREFTQGFHIQNTACEDTNITYALNLIINYNYDPEDATLHNLRGKAKPKKNKWQQAEVRELPLENLLADDLSELSVLDRVKNFFKNLFKNPNLTQSNFFDTYGFQRVEDVGYPKHQTVCIYIWKDKQGQLLWQNGIYDQRRKEFSVTYGTTVYVIKQSKVVAWKKMNEDALKLDSE